MSRQEKIKSKQKQVIFFAQGLKDENYQSDIQIIQDLLKEIELLQFVEDSLRDLHAPDAAA